MPRLFTQAKSHKPQHAGFSIIELLAVATVLTIVTAFGLMGVAKARASVRLSGAARQYASYVEKARIFSIRRHADDAATRASVLVNANKLSYDVTMDLDGDGGMDTRTIRLPSGIEFDRVESIAFDWRGRTLNIIEGVTYPNSQVSVRLKSSDDSISIDITGSGDVTIDSAVFDDNVPNVSLHVADLAAGATPEPTPASTLPSASPSTSPIIPDVPVVTPSPLPDVTGGLPTASPSPSPSPVATATPNPTPRGNPTPTPSPVTPCTITTDPVTVIMGTEETVSVKVSHTSDTSVSVSANSSKASDLQVSPNAAQTVAARSSMSFTIKSKKSAGVYSVTFSAGCGSKAVVVTVL